jgi:hypothetical protein
VRGAAFNAVESVVVTSKSTKEQNSPAVSLSFPCQVFTCAHTQHVILLAKHFTRSLTD